MTFMKGARPWAVHSYCNACNGVADTVMQSTWASNASKASRTPGNGPHPWTMSAIDAFTASPHAIAREMVAEG